MPNKEDPTLDGLTGEQLLWRAVFCQAMRDRRAGQNIWHRGSGVNNSREWWIQGWWIGLSDVLGIGRAEMQRELVRSYVLPAAWVLPEEPGHGVEPKPAQPYPPAVGPTFS